MATDWLWLKNRLVSTKTKANSFWLPSLSSSILDIGELIKIASNIKDHSLNGIMDFLGRHEYVEIDLKRLRDIPENESMRRFGTTDDLFKIFQNDFIKLHKQIKRQARESGDVGLFIGLPIIEGRNEFGDYFRAPLLYVQVEMEPVSQYQKIILHINQTEYILNPTILGVEVNKKGILFKNQYNPKKLDLNEALNCFKDLDIYFKAPLTNEVVPFVKKTKSDFGEATKGYSVNLLTNNVLLGLFEVKGDKLFQDFTTMMGNDPDAIDQILSSKRDLIFNHKKFMDDFDLSQIYLYSHLDIYQQLAVKHALVGDIVVEGPPGTGKSETILNILINIVLNNKTALFVSEKATAMEVVYNRLGNLKHIAMYIPSLTENKKQFYKQFADFEQYFSENYSNQLLNTPMATFDNKLVPSYYKLASEIENFYNQKINTGTQTHLFKDILLNFKLMDVSFIKLDDVARFEEWLSVFTNQSWLEQHVAYNELHNQLINSWGRDTFNAFYHAWHQEPENYKRFMLIIHNFYKKKLIEVPKLSNPFFKPTPKEEKTFNLLSLQIKRFDSLKKFASKSKYQTIKHCLENNVLANKKAVFYSWFMQEQSAPYIAKVDELQCNFSQFQGLFSQSVYEYIEACKRNLKSKIIKNFFQIYESDKKQLLEICRQGRNSNPKEIPWWFSINCKIINRLYPIHIMSFESASILLENKRDLYDYVIIDEASQVFLERALPALYRGKRYIIAGDTKQLHPSSFFQSRANYEDDAFAEIDENNAIETDEAVNAVSLIHFLKERARLSSMLKYHYRSNFSNLIAFTNSHIYGNELIFMDKAIRPNQTFIVHEISSGKWQNNRNIEEAQEVVKRLQKLVLSDDYQKTIGIITFNKTQADFIENLLDKVNDPLINEWRERTTPNGEYIGLFVKNVENVQGDERDIIIFSLGYDKSVNNYGPISKEEGANRLNVAITRAKSRIELFKTNKANEYSGWASNSEGARLLVEYLSYCEEQASSSNFKKQAITNPSESINFAENAKIATEVWDLLNQVFGQYFDLKKNVLEGTYFFNIVFYKDGIPKLAVDIDLPQFDGISQFYENLIYKNIFLQKRGWKHFRIWTSDWKLFKKKVLLDIKQMLTEK